tara:strand:+ start:208 stop:474 length:267 start_codon:yes stop_codon:yes gene_type:complete
MSAIDKVTYELVEAHKELQSNDMPLMYDFLAERAILALRTPSEEMMQVFDALPLYHNRLDMWCAMIDVALGRLKIVEEKEDQLSPEVR